MQESMSAMVRGLLNARSGSGGGSGSDVAL